MIARRIVVTALVFVVAYATTSCRNGDAASDTSEAANAVLVGPENVVVVKAEELHTGPTLSGAIEA